MASQSNPKPTPDLSTMLGGDSSLYNEAEPTDVDLGDAHEPDQEPAGEGAQDTPAPATEKPAEPAPATQERSEPEPAAAQESAEPVAPTEPKTDPASPSIPKWRLDQQTKKMRSYEEMLTKNGIDPKTGQPMQQPPVQPQAQQPPAQEPPAEPAAPDPRIEQAQQLWDQYNDAAIDGDSEKANQLLRQARELDNQVLQDQMQARIDKQLRDAEQRTTQQSSVQARMETALPDVLKQYPGMDDSNDGFNSEALQEAISLKDFYTQQGMDPVAALWKAADVASRAYDAPTNITGQTGQPAAPAEPAAPAAPKAQQPPRTTDRDSTARAQADELSPSRMTDAQWDELTDAKRSELLGDSL